DGGASPVLRRDRNALSSSTGLGDFNMKRILLSAALAVLTSGCANILERIGDKERLGPPDLFSTIVISRAGATAETASDDVANKSGGGATQKAVVLTPVGPSSAAQFAITRTPVPSTTAPLAEVSNVQVRVEGGAKVCDQARPSMTEVAPDPGRR